MHIVPFGEVLEDRLELSKKYGLIEMIGGIWRFTAKCKKHYELESYIYYLQGKLKKPCRARIDPYPIKNPHSPTLKREGIIKELFEL